MGRLIIVEGLDGSGKSTQVELLSRRLTEAGVAVRTVSFPHYESDSSALVKMYLAGDFGTKPGDVNAYAASLFFSVDRFASFRTDWEAHYRAGGTVLAARYTTSNAIHQAAKLPREEWDGYLDWLFETEYGKIGLPKPDLVVFLDMPPEVSQTMMTGRYGGDESKKDIHERDLAYLNNCREAARYIAARYGWQVIGCAENGSPRPIESISDELMDCVLQTIGK